MLLLAKFFFIKTWILKYKFMLLIRFENFRTLFKGGVFKDPRYFVCLTVDVILIHLYIKYQCVIPQEISPFGDIAVYHC